MRLVLNGKINRTYVQTLCMMFFHGEKFPENVIEDNRQLSVITIDTERGISCTCELKYDGMIAKSSSFAQFEENEKYERTSKTAVGMAVYDAGVQITGKKIPWGILTGIRPSKVAHDLILKVGEEKAKIELQEKYLLSSDKASLAINVAKNEWEILDRFDDKTCSIYISIPFCPSRCTYCSFISYATTKLFELIPKYLEQLLVDIEKTFDRINKLGLRVVSIYIGGGTPTVLNEEQLEKLLSSVARNVNTESMLEFTLEGGRPDTINKKKLEIAKKYGVNRISVNPQTLNDNVLKAIGRRHTVEEFFSAYEIVKNSDINYVNTDLIAGLDLDTFESFKETVDKIIDLAPDNVTVHSFSVKKSAQILRDNGEIYEIDGNDAIMSVDYAYTKLTENGYVPYYMYRQKNTVSDLENVGYAKIGTFGIYNVLMMSDTHTVFGIGAGSTTKLVRKNKEILEINRIFSPKYPYEYLQDKQDHEQEIFNFFGKAKK